MTAYRVLENPTEASVREVLATLAPDDRCDPECPGWAIFNGDEIQRCDDCAHAIARKGGPLLDDVDVALLPEAIMALANEIDPVYVCGCSWLGGDPEMRRGRAYCPACLHHDRRRVRVFIDKDFWNPARRPILTPTPNHERDTTNG